MSPTYDFRGKVALITGAGSGMGLAAASAFAQAGAAVALADVNVQALQAATDDLILAGHQAMGVTCDVSDENQVAATVEQAITQFGRPTSPDQGDHHMQITRSSSETQKGPADWFTGDVYIDAIADPAGTSTFAAANVHFTPGARTVWHTHPHGQTIFVTEGVGLCQREGGLVEVIHPGDRVFFEPGENHWHGAVHNRFMVHIAMQQNDESGSPVTWGKHVTDEQYSAAPATGT